ncbi:putative ABC transporter ATP-binding protein [Anaerocolumna cellulosilytica]|uniref:Putative ABC transporter ATP-binding protein n=1 Tax=Anaerocolumna cellulosilytica TaxID=433286 RepID=A0A6S6QZG8_9FIRM|nr:ABC transporter ATP-binding protein/permease [Anaerocolumna cellulosilytica]MBB5195119.1 ABC-type transport system involved in cytochrome bd biosynthesis fused ATPase/permease subunit [Anaerocolumna cellulosilytica]BCJ96044.1 putative ABC transporter ATP-binding protein [Anaerocolumna cellulosilytica]
MIKKRLISYLAGTKKYIEHTVVFLWLALLANVFNTYLFMNILKYGLHQKLTFNSTLFMGMFIILALIVRNLCHTFSSKASAKASAYVKKELRDRIYEKLLRLGIAYQEKMNTSEVVQAAVEGVEQLEVYFSRYLPQFFYSMLAPLTLFVLLSFVNLKAAVVLLVCVPLIPVTIIVISKIAKKILKKYWGSYTDLGQRFLENLQGLVTLKIYQADEKKAEEMDIEAENFRKITMRMLSMQLNSITVMDIIAYGGAAAGIIIAILEYQKGSVDFTGAFLIIMLSSEFFLPLRLLGSFFHIAMNGMAASEKIFFLLDMEEQRAEGTIEPKKAYQIVGDKLTFSYDGNRIILNKLDFIIKEKQITALVGASGCGKSTIAALLTGRLHGYEGGFTLGDTEILNIAKEELMKVITLVSHNSYLFQGTVEDTLRMGKEDATGEEMEAVLHKVGLLKFIKRNGGLSYKVQEKASNLSGGQAQRLALARALLHDTPIYVFDEVTSNIDAESEKRIMSVIYELAQHKTVLLISHRLQNVVASHQILVLKQGEIVQSGTHNELIKKEGMYRSLFESQKTLEAYAEQKNTARREESVHV